MNLLTRTQHTWIDVVVVVVFALGPIVFGLGAGAAAISYVLAGVHLVMTLGTDGLPMAPGRFLPLPLHGLIEAVAGVALGLIGWFAFDGVERGFYLVMAVLILGVFATTPYVNGSTRS